MRHWEVIDTTTKEAVSNIEDGGYFWPRLVDAQAYAEWLNTIDLYNTERATFQPDPAWEVDKEWQFAFYITRKAKTLKPYERRFKTHCVVD